MTESLRFQVEEDMIIPTVDLRKASPVAIRLFSFEKSQGSVGPPPPRPCMSLHWSGAMKE